KACVIHSRLVPAANPEGPASGGRWFNALSDQRTGVGVNAPDGGAVARVAGVRVAWETAVGVAAVPRGAVPRSPAGVGATAGSAAPPVWTSPAGGATVDCGVVRSAVGVVGPLTTSFTTSCTLPRSSAAIGCQLTGLSGPSPTGAAPGARPGSGNCGSHMNPSNPATETRQTVETARRTAVGLPQFHIPTVNRRPSENSVYPRPARGMNSSNAWPAEASKPATSPPVWAAANAWPC